ncbi:hypothetical protein EIN_344900 [Entamoeba invadens IP1]|uniref:Uncharacterized protein n=1 Tax=Entamoeba invadens IP1 TaxID=370355 RepID=A0A0A1U6S7_ENTIV|nr:hypothetical protein EIN_344900 [Entamoeba invadens IP1]ELP88530.1 hypothetical protein EIN_344900 [Entamoeba invadens IP1]|eukprot:XP_004255301.1 hypothetical protein EIN_344900 [Entamoeba invadens IP1]
MEMICTPQNKEFADQPQTFNSSSHETVELTDDSKSRNFEDQRVSPLRKAPKPNHSEQQVKTKRVRKYQNYFLQYGFSYITENSVQKPHKEYTDKPLFFFIGLSLKQDTHFLSTIQKKIEDDINVSDDDLPPLPIETTKNKEVFKPRKEPSVEAKRITRKVTTDTCRSVVDSVLSEIANRICEVNLANEFKKETKK